LNGITIPEKWLYVQETVGENLENEICGKIRNMKTAIKVIL
jgi:hypothetical protein